jgi:hypothetical protein
LDRGNDPFDKGRVYPWPGAVVDKHIGGVISGKEGKGMMHRRSPGRAAGDKEDSRLPGGCKKPGRNRVTGGGFPIRGDGDNDGLYTGESNKGAQGCPKYCEGFTVNVKIIRPKREVLFFYLAACGTRVHAGG